LVWLNQKDQWRDRNEGRREGLLHEIAERSQIRGIIPCWKEAYKETKIIRSILIKEARATPELDSSRQTTDSGVSFWFKGFLLNYV